MGGVGAVMALWRRCSRRPIRRCARSRLIVAASFASPNVFAFVWKGEETEVWLRFGPTEVKSRASLFF